MDFGYDAAEMVDANLLIYGVLEDHPAAPASQAHLESSQQPVASILSLVEFYFVTTKVYGIEPEDALQKVNDFLASPLTFLIPDASIIVVALELCAAYRIDVNDAVQAQLCLELGVSHLATDDRRLRRVCTELGIGTTSPITPEIQRAMARWEAMNLPEKGLPRILHHIHGWLGEHDETIAASFHEATRGLQSLP